MADDKMLFKTGHIVPSEGLLDGDHPATRLRRTRGTSEGPPETPGRFAAGHQVDWLRWVDLLSVITGVLSGGCA